MTKENGFYMIARISCFKMKQVSLLMTKFNRVWLTLSLNLGFKLFQEKVSGLKLLYHRSILAIHLNGQQQSSDQDIRLWSTDETNGTLILMFYTNSRRNEAKDHQQFAGTGLLY